MEINITIEKKYLWILILAVVAVGFAVAYGGNNPVVMGHTTGEIDGLDQKITDVVNGQANNLLAGKQVLTWKYFTIGSNAPWPKKTDTSLASFTTIYGRGALEMKGCMAAMHQYCYSEGYAAALPLGLSCGWQVQQDASCPNDPCQLAVFCIKEK